MSKFLIDGKLYDPIKVGDPSDWDEGNPEAVCDDCGAKYGEQHMEGCDIERCPFADCNYCLADISFKMLRTILSWKKMRR